jgi:hypothetical protein
VGEGEERSSVIAADGDDTQIRRDAQRARERRRQQLEAEKQLEQAEIAEGIRRVRNTVIFVVVMMAIAWGIWWVNQKWGGHWPILFTWGVMSVAILAGFGWIFWYMDNGD